MFCPKCGNILPDNAKFCSSCGAKIERKSESNYTTKINEDCDHPHNETFRTSANPVGFRDALQRFFLRFRDFSGRSGRAEFWWAILFLGLVNGFLSSIAEDARTVWSIITFIPLMALTVRRLHDIGKSGYHILWHLVPVFGNIYMLILMARPSMGENEWGTGAQ